MNPPNKIEDIKSLKISSVLMIGFGAGIITAEFLVWLSYPVLAQILANVYSGYIIAAVAIIIGIAMQWELQRRTKKLLTGKKSNVRPHA